MIDDDIFKIERELSIKAKASILVLIHELSYMGSTREERVTAYEALDKWLTEQAKQNRYYPSLREFTDETGSKLLHHSNDSSLLKRGYQ